MSASRKLIYFCGSMRAGRQDVDLYGTLVEKLGRSLILDVMFCHKMALLGMAK